MDGIDRRAPSFAPLGQPWPEAGPDALCPQVQLAGFYVMRAPTAPRYRVRGLHLMVITGGAIRFARRDGRAGRAAAGEAVWFANGVNRYLVEDGEPLLVYQVHVTAGSGALATALPVLPGIGALPERFALGERAREFATRCEDIIGELLAPGPAWRLRTGAAAMDLVRLSFEAAAGAVRPPRARLDRWQRLLARLEDDGRDHRVGDLAREAGMSAEGFIRAFRLHTGSTPKQYLIKRRLWKARRLLQRGASAKEAAFRCGFADPLYFSRQYRRLFGHPPSRAAADDGRFPDHDGGVPISRHLLAPGVDVGAFTAQ